MTTQRLNLFLLALIALLIGGHLLRTPAAEAQQPKTEMERDAAFAALTFLEMHRLSIIAASAFVVTDEYPPLPSDRQDGQMYEQAPDGTILPVKYLVTLKTNGKMVSRPFLTTAGGLAWASEDWTNIGEYEQWEDRFLGPLRSLIHADFSTDVL